MNSKRKIVLKFISISILFLLFSVYMRNPVLMAAENNNIYRSMVFGVTIDDACYHVPNMSYGSINLQNSLKEVDKAVELGVDFVRIDLRDETLRYPGEINKLDRIISYARSRKLKIYIGAYGMQSWLPGSISVLLNHLDGGAGIANWNEFKRMYRNEITYLANRYHPDYMMIMVELRFNLGNEVNSVRSIEEWVQFTKSLADLIKSISPRTKIVLNEIAQRNTVLNNIAYIRAIMQDNYQKIDIIGIDPYSYEALKDGVSTIVKFEKEFNWHGEIWIGETNLFKFNDVREQRNYFIYAINLALRNGFSGFCIFYFRDGSGTTKNTGILYENFEPKPAYNVIKQMLRWRKLVNIL